MAPLPPSNTIRYFLDVALGAVEHTIQIRANAVASPANIGSLMGSILNSLTPDLSAMTVVRLRVALAGSNISNPVISGIEGNVYGSGTPTGLTQSTSLDFVGRSSTGRRARCSIFGYKQGFSDFRVTTAENTNVLAALGTIQGALNSFLAIDGTKPVWYPYVNVSYNAYWQRTLRA